MSCAVRLMREGLTWLDLCCEEVTVLLAGLLPNHSVGRCNCDVLFRSQGGDCAHLCSLEPHILHPCGCKAKTETQLQPPHHSARHHPACNHSA